MRKFGLVAGISCLAFWEVSADVVSRIKYEGLERVEEAALEDDLTIKPGKEYNRDDVDASIKKLYAKDFFSDIDFYKRGDTLVIKVKEKPMVDQVAFEGNDNANDDMLKAVVHGRIGEGRLFSLHVIKDILADLQMAYKVWGYYSPEIKPQIIKKPGNKVDVVFKIHEGEKTTVRKIIFIGNKAFSDDEIKSVMSIKEAKFWRFWDYDSHIFREDRLDVDIDAITKFYKSRGYPFFMITSSRAELSYDKKSHYCVFMMEEGDKYTFGNATLVSKVDKIKADDYKEIVQIKNGDTYNETRMNNIKKVLLKTIALKDNPFIDVEVDVQYNREAKTADVVYTVVSRPKTFVERIEITGNTRTLDRVIRRELTVHEGDALNAHKVQRSVERLENMGYFEEVNVDEEEGSSPDKRVLNVKVKEKDSTASIKFGLTLNDADGFGGMIGWNEQNFMGTGKIASIEANWMQKYYGLTLDMFDPRFFDQNVGAGLRIGGCSVNRKKFEGASVRSLFISPYIKYIINQHLSHRVGLMFSFNKKQAWNEDLNKWSDALQEYYVFNNRKYRVINHDILQEEYGRYKTFSITSTLTYYDTDNQYNPTYGYDISLTNSYAGLFGNVKYFKNILELNIYRPVTERMTFIINGQIGHIHEIDHTRSSDRFVLGGGQSMRGFDSYGIGARAVMDEIIYDNNGNEVGRRQRRDNSIGSTKFWTTSFMLKAPLSTKEIGMNGVAFVDFGSAWGSRHPKEKIKDSSKIRGSAGVAIEWAKCPLGMPMSIVFGFAFMKQPYDETEKCTITGLL